MQEYPNTDRGSVTYCCSSTVFLNSPTTYRQTTEGVRFEESDLRDSPITPQDECLRRVDGSRLEPCILYESFILTLIT